MTEREEVKKAICYITGEIKLEFRPPNGFEIEPKVMVDDLPAYVKTTEEQDPKIWKYLAVVEKGERDVEVVLGHVHSKREKLTVRGAQVTILDFYFTTAE